MIQMMDVIYRTLISIVFMGLSVLSGLIVAVLSLNELLGVVVATMGCILAFILAFGCMEYNVGGIFQ